MLKIGVVLFNVAIGWNLLSPTVSTLQVTEDEIIDWSVQVGFKKPLDKGYKKCSRISLGSLNRTLKNTMKITIQISESKKKMHFVTYKSIKNLKYSCLK